MNLVYDKLFPKPKERPPSANVPVTSQNMRKMRSIGNITSNMGTSNHWFSMPTFNDKKRGLVRPSTAPRKIAGK